MLFLGLAMLLLTACFETHSSYEARTSCELKSYTDDDKPLTCPRTLKVWRTWSANPLVRPGRVHRVRYCADHTLDLPSTKNIHICSASFSWLEYSGCWKHRSALVGLAMQSALVIHSSHELSKKNHEKLCFSVISVVKHWNNWRKKTPKKLSTASSFRPALAR